MASVERIASDDLLVDQPGHLDWGVLVGGKHRLQPGALACGEQRDLGAQAPPGPVERITGPTAVAESVPLNALAAQIEFGPGHGFSDR